MAWQPCVSPNSGAIVHHLEAKSVIRLSYNEANVWATTLSHMQILRLVRGAFAALGIAAGVAGALRLRGSGGVPPRSGGWRELTGDELN